MIIENSDERVVFKVVDEQDDGDNPMLDAIYGEIWSDSDFKTEFYENFEIAGTYLADEDFYQGLNKTTVIVRNSDGKAFGYSWWDDISKHGESYVECNGDERGFETEYTEDYETIASYWVWLPVEPFNITGYSVIENG